MRLSHSLITVPTSVSLIIAALLTVDCSNSGQLTATGGASGTAGRGAGGAIGGAAGTATGVMAGGNAAGGATGAIGGAAGTATGGVAGADGTTPQDAGVSTNCGPSNCDFTQTFCYASTPGSVGYLPYTYSCQTFPTACAANPTCACVCGPLGCTNSRICSCSDTNGVIRVNCSGE